MIPVCCRTVSGEINLLKYFQQQRLEHTRLLRKERGEEMLGRVPLLRPGLAVGTRQRPH